MKIMKKILKDAGMCRIAIMGFIMTILCSCGAKTIKGEDGIKYENYREACRNGNFDVAHKFLDRLKEKATKTSWWDAAWEVYNDEAEEAEEYIYRQEALFLMSQNDDDAKKRLIYLIKEEERGNNLIEMLIDLAIGEKDEDFVRMLAEQLSGSVNDELLNKVGSFFLTNGSEESLELVFSLFEKANKESLLLDVLAKNLRTGNSSLGISDKLLALLASKENEIPTRPALGTIKSNYNGKLDDNYMKYIDAIKAYNDACRNILTISIKTKNINLARRIITKPKQNIEYKILGDWESVVEKSKYSSVYNAIKVSLSNDDINSIKSAYQEAVRNGEFK